MIDPVDLPDIDKVTEPEFDALNYEFKHGINAYLKYLAAFTGDSGLELPGTLADLIEFNERNARQVLARFGQEIFHAAQATNGDLADPVYLELRGAASILARTAVETPVVEHNLDAIFSLTANPAWLTDYVLGDHSVFGTSRPGAVSGWPAITVPFGYVCGLPVGVSFLGPRWSEPRLLALAYAFEQATNSRRAPDLLPDNHRARLPVSEVFAFAKANTRQANARAHDSAYEGFAAYTLRILHDHGLGVSGAAVKRRESPAGWPARRRSGPAAARSRSSHPTGTARRPPCRSGRARTARSG